MAGEVITSPAPTVGYDPPWVHPQVPDPAGTIVNAFALGVHSNLMRQQIQGKLAQLALANEKLQFQMEKSGEEFDFKYNALAQKDQYDRMMMDHRNNMQELDYKKLDNLKDEERRRFETATLEQDRKAEYNNAGSSMYQDLSENPYTVGTTNAAAWAEEKMRDYSDWMDDKNIQNIRDTERKRQTQASLGIHRDAADQLKFYQDDRRSILGSKGIPEYHWNQSDTMWGKDDVKKTRWIAYRPKTGEIIEPKNAAGIGEDKLGEQGISVAHLNQNDYNRLRREEAGIRKYAAGGDLAPAPVDPNLATRPMTRDLATQFLQDAGGNKEKARQLARAAGYTF